MGKKKKKRVSALHDAYLKERKNLFKRISYYSKKYGLAFKISLMVPDVPKRITHSSINRLKKMNGDYIRSWAYNIVYQADGSYTYIPIGKRAEKADKKAYDMIEPVEKIAMVDIYDITLAIFEEYLDKIQNSDVADILEQDFIFLKVRCFDKKTGTIDKIKLYELLKAFLEVTIDPMDYATSDPALLCTYLNKHEEALEIPGEMIKIHENLLYDNAPHGKYGDLLYYK